MPRTLTIIHQYGRPKIAKDINGDIIHRQDSIYVPSYKQSFPVLDYDNHFVYATRNIGSSLMCTCGSPAVVVGYRAYKQYESYKGMNVIACLSHINTGKHADGSS
jgi:hypothetical protein